MITTTSLFSLEKFRFSSNAEPTHNFELVTDIKLSDKLGDLFGHVRFSKPDFNNSGDIRLAWDRTGDYNYLYTYENDGKQVEERKFEAALGLGDNIDNRDSYGKAVDAVSPYGNYYAINEYLEPPQKGIHRKNITRLYDRNHNLLWQKTLEKATISTINEKGISKINMDYNNSVLYDKNGNYVTKLLNEKEILNQVGVENKTSKRIKYKGWLLTDKILYTVSNGSELDMEDFAKIFDGKAFILPATMSGEFIGKSVSFKAESFAGKTEFSWNDNFVYTHSLTDYGILYNIMDQKIVTKIQGYTGQHVYSPNESIALLKGYVVDTQSGEKLKWIGTAARVAIADKDYPFVAFMDGDYLYVGNYETEEVIIKDKFTNKRYTGGCDKIQISGNGKEVSVVFRDMYRKYRVGGRK